MACASTGCAYRCAIDTAYGRSAAGRGLKLQFPSLAERRSKMLVRFRVVGEEPRLGIVFELTFEPIGDGAERDPLCEGPGYAEVRAGGFTSFAGSEPVTIVPERAGQNGTGKSLVPPPCGRR